MASTQYIIVYSPNQNARRRVVKPDDDSQIAGHIATHLPGEAYLLVSIDDYNSQGPDALLLAHTGNPPSSDHCMIIQDGTCLGHCKADPLIDTHPDGELVNAVVHNAVADAVGIGA